MASSGSKGLLAPPFPLQDAFRSGRDLESLADAQTFHPENLAGFIRPDDEPTPLLTRDLLVHEQILQLHRAGHPNGLKPISSAPVTQHDASADGIRVEEFSAGMFARNPGAACRAPR